MVVRPNLSVGRRRHRALRLDGSPFERHRNLKRVLIYSGNSYLPLVAQYLDRHVSTVPAQHQVDG